VVSSKKVEHFLSNFCKALQLMVPGSNCCAHGRLAPDVDDDGQSKDGRYQEYNNHTTAWMSGLTLQLTMDAILNHVMQRRHYDIIVYEWSLSALTLFSSLGSSNQATFLVSTGAIQRTLQFLGYFPPAERLHCVGMVALSHMVANATSPSLQEAMSHGGNTENGYSLRATAPSLFLFESLVRTMEKFPNSAPICEHACSTFGAAYVQNGHELRRRCAGTADSATSGTAAGQTEDDILLFRAFECVYHGLILHSDHVYSNNAEEDQETSRVLTSFLRLFAVPDLAHLILHQVECQLCHGGAA
jgi:hypothetical protein